MCMHFKQKYSCRNDRTGLCFSLLRRRCKAFRLRRLIDNPANKAPFVALSFAGFLLLGIVVLTKLV